MKLVATVPLPSRAVNCVSSRMRWPLCARRSPTLRITLLAVIFLVIGAVVNVGVAWVGVVLAPTQPVVVDSASSGGWPCDVPGDWPSANGMSVMQYGGVRSMMWSWSRPVWQRRTLLLGPSIQQWHAGWPTKGLMWEVWHYDRRFGVHGAKFPLWRLGIPIGHEWKALPIRPRWPGFASNTLLYAAVTAGVWYGPVVTRREIRRRRRQCISCGYPRAGLAEGATCPECGGGSKP
jgi:hypothetical protein